MVVVPAPQSGVGFRVELFVTNALDVPVTKDNIILPIMAHLDFPSNHRQESRALGILTLIFSMFPEGSIPSPRNFICRTYLVPVPTARGLMLARLVRGLIGCE